MDHEMPFSDEVMTIIMGIQPEAPGQHGRVCVPMPTEDAVNTIMQIRDLCEKFLMSCGKDGGKDPEQKPEQQPELEEEEEGE